MFNRHNGKVVTHARVTIVMYDRVSYMTNRVPTMMMGAHAGMADYHYGNNVHAGPGYYTITVRVNGVSGRFSVHVT